MYPSIIRPKVCIYLNIYLPIWACWISPSKTSLLNKISTRNLQYVSEFVLIHPKKHLWGPLFIPKMFNGVEIKALWTTLKFLHTKLIRLCLYGPRFVERSTDQLEQETVATKLEACSCLILCCSISITHSLETRSLIQTLKKPHTIIPSPPNFTVGTTHSSRYCSLGVPDPGLSIRLTDETWFITPENTFPLLQSPVPPHFIAFQPTFGIVTLGLHAAAQPWKPMSGQI